MGIKFPSWAWFVAAMAPHFLSKKQHFDNKIVRKTVSIVGFGGHLRIQRKHLQKINISFFTPPIDFCRCKKSVYPTGRNSIILLYSIKDLWSQYNKQITLKTKPNMKQTEMIDLNITSKHRRHTDKLA